ncbi:hypothetical protein [Vibrio rumoiensis]|uniref:hypothetical protein n=1 Tax=Vibrio rumoiensis TaxID=76258 RepID=UPI0002D92CC0|nr:hypothetical protein [Vibrio rumoiensis]
MTLSKPQAKHTHNAITGSLQPSTVVKQACAGVFLCFSLTLVLFPINGYAASKEDLKGVSAEISRQKSSISGQQKKLNELQSELKNHEVSISKLGQEINHTEQELRKVQGNLIN